MKVKILLNLPKTIDGKPIGPFTAGQECELDDDTARTFIASAMAEKYVQQPDTAPTPRAPRPAAEPTSGASDAEQAENEGVTRRARRRAE